MTLCGIPEPPEEPERVESALELEFGDVCLGSKSECSECDQRQLYETIKKLCLGCHAVWIQTLKCIGSNTRIFYLTISRLRNNIESMTNGTLKKFNASIGP
jgi:hypothetical protein